MPFPRHDTGKSLRNLRIVIKAEDGIGLGEFCSQVPTITLAEAANRNDRAGTSGCLLEIRGREHRVDRILFRHLHETSRVHQYRRGVTRVIDEFPARRREPPR